MSSKLSKEMRLLQTKFASAAGWPKRLEWLEVVGIRGWKGQRVNFNFPMVAICGENGCGKSTILQGAASVYESDDEEVKPIYPSDFFPDTPWDRITDAALRYQIKEGNAGSRTIEMNKYGERWTGYYKRTKREVQYIDLARIQPISSRTGFSRLAKSKVTEKSFQAFPAEKIERLSAIMGKEYAKAKMALTDADDARYVSVVSVGANDFSAYHQGAGEFTITELLNFPFRPNSMLLIDEVETSLHPRAQRRLVRDLAELCRKLELQIILTTHSPYVLEEFPPEARCYILQSDGKKEIVFGVSPEFAMTKMDDESHPECDLYVEDERSKILLREIIVTHAPDLLGRCQIIGFGAASVGMSLGQMVKQDKFPRPSLVFLDGDQEKADGCIILPQGDAPERVVFEKLKATRWGLLEMRTGRSFSQIEDACTRAMTAADHHEWVNSAGKDLLLGGDTLWQIMASTWAGNCLTKEEAEAIIKPIRIILAEN